MESGANRCLSLLFGATETDEVRSSTRRNQQRQRLVWSLMGVVALTGCNLLAGFEDLGNSLVGPDAELLDRPGRQLVKGSYSRLLVDGSMETGGYVLAQRTDTPEPRLAIVPFLSGDPCEISPAHGFERLSSRVDMSLPGLAAVQVDRNEAGHGTIRFVDFNCQDQMPALENAILPRVQFPASAPRGLLTITQAGQVYLADAERKQLELIAENVSQASVSTGRLWTVEKGTLQIRNDQLRILESLGEEVFRYVPTSLPEGEIEVLYEDKHGLHFWKQGQEPVSLGKDACSPVLLSSRVIAYYQPCETRRAVFMISDLGPRFAERLRLLGPENVNNLSQTYLTESTSPSEQLHSESTLYHLYFMTHADPLSLTGAVHYALIPQGELPSQEDGDTYELSTQVLLENGVVYGNTLFEDWNGETGRLWYHSRPLSYAPEGLILLGEDVAQVNNSLSPFSREGALVRFNGETGDLVQLGFDYPQASEKLIASRVPRQAPLVDVQRGRYAFIANYEKGKGDLFLVLEQAPPLRVAENVLLNTARFLSQPPGVAFFSPNPGGKGAQLRAYLSNSGLEPLIHPAANEYVTTPWPSPGILYSVTEGEDAGLWFSKAR